MHTGTASSRALCLVLVALTCAPLTAWKLPFFNYNQETEISLHPLSPRVDDNVRHKRQAYQLSVNGDDYVTVDQYGGGQPESGAWGQWTREGECSRTCGGGVQTEKRQCNGDCTGPSVRYQSCNLDSCPEDSQDFREEQCAQHNDDVLDGKYFSWVPFKGSNKCELTCKPLNESFYYKWGDKVVDGTKCDQTSDDICVDGICLPLGCDGKLGSLSKVDKCGVCNGTGNTCKSQEGLVKESTLSSGYNNIVVLPVGATAIKIEETQQTSNSLAIRNDSGHYFLNGNNRITLGDQEVVAGGTVFKYQKPKLESGSAETLTAKGPLKEEITIQLLYQGSSQGGSVKYHFSTPLDEDIPFIYKPGEWSACSVTCGKGTKTREAICTDAKTGQKVEEGLCEENNSTKPETEKSCVTVDCEAEWFVGEWEECSQSCGEHGLQYRVIYCHKVFANGKRMTVDDENCTSTERPAVRQTCNRFSCPEWNTGPWSACSEKCGDAKQYRSVTCRSEKEGEEGKLLPAESCPSGVEHDTERYCNLGPCEGLHFVTTEWDLCERCTDTEETRNVTCQDQTGRPYPLEKCLNENSTEIPTERACATAIPCVHQWHVSEWSKCSTECGHGHKERKVHCALNELGTINIVDDEKCSSEKPNVTEECVNEAKCTGTWFSGPWSNCTAECGGGQQERFAVCLNYDRNPVPEWCDESNKPALVQNCNEDPCPTCFDSDFGCCPDNVTFAQGDWFEGCSNCSLSEFGCCADNVTEAIGPDAKGCDEYVEPTPGSGEEPEAEATSETETEDVDKECEATNEETGEIVKILCSALNETLGLENLLFGNETEDVNVTKHCSKTEFGCCPDWYTEAEGKDFLGCPEFVLGACNETKYGCCNDNVTLARGPNFEGCGEPVCAASRFGCCKDRKTIAFGPSYAGCERSTFPCENGPFGCCPDGETGALDRNGTGCGVQCLLTKYGCCPDGVTVSKGVNNEGCGCEFSQYGCCPDGKASAKGAGYYGCPESCAQSQYGCCPDGKTAARGPSKEGCPCQYTKFGCCPDGETTALGPGKEGCNDCRYAKYGCCSDGESKALGPNGSGCPTTTKPPFIVAGTVSPAKLIACNLPQEKGELCLSQYALRWFFDSAEARCSQFWFGGCGGNENNFATKEECETVCVEPPELGRCYLPKVEGPNKCNDLKPRYWYDYTTKRCDAFWWRGCLGNANNFDSWESCQRFCSNVGPTTTVEPVTVDPISHQREYERRRQEEDHRQRAQEIQQSQSQSEEDARRRAEWEQRNREYLESIRSQKKQQGIPQVPNVPQASSAPQAPTAPQAPSVPQQTSRSDPVCSQLVNSGDCNNYEDMWYFNVFNQECHQFIYGGCHGNDNRFKTKNECLQRCGYLRQNTTVARPATGGNNRDACNLPKDIGTCSGKFDTYFYNPSSDACEIFQYSGCGGNRNRFTSKEQCQYTCQRSASAGSNGQAGGVPQEVSSLSASERCEAPPDKGPCTKFTTMWFFKKTDGTCTRFYYGGCKGNGNLFKTEQECKDICGSYLNVCELPAVKGPCGGHHQKFYYDKEAKECRQFEFSGCLGNGNNFATQEQCEERCSHAPQEMTQYEEMIRPTTLQICSMPYSTGPCRAMIPQYYYDIRSQTCREFSYGGCAGNANRFDTKEQCQQTCGMVDAAHVDRYYHLYDGTELATHKHHKKHLNHHLIRRDERSHSTEDATVHSEEGTVTSDEHSMNSNHDSGRYEDSEQQEVIVPSNVLSQVTASTDEYETVPEVVTVHPQKITDIPELCLAPQDPGPCHGSILRWYFNPEQGKCKSFLFTGCQGNANNFQSLEGCQRACGEYRQQRVCSELKESGDCHVRAPKWFYDNNKGDCALFWWSGCGGNGNRFSSKAECDSLCKVELPADQNDDICLLQQDSGPCQDPITQYYYDSNDGNCKKFTFGGCRGNANRFNTKEECSRRCRAPVGHIVKMLEPKDICSMNFDAGPCSGVEKKWFFDMSIGTCRSFTYGGCAGNDNRFDSELDCYNQCKSFVDMKKERRVKAEIEIAHSGIFKPGDDITMKCLYGEIDSDAIWFKNDIKLDLQPPKYQGNGNILKITDAQLSDSGSYSCNAGIMTLLSQPKKVVVKEPSYEVCVDRGSHHVCNMVLRTNLCHNQRYYNFCCQTCNTVTRRR